MAPKIGEAYPLAVAAAHQMIAMADMTLEEFEASLVSSSPDDLATLMHGWGDSHQMQFDVGYPTLDRVVRRELLDKGRDDFEVAVRTHPREASAEKSRVGVLRELIASLVPAEEWRTAREEDHKRMSDATDAAVAARQAWEARVEEIRPEFQQQYDAAHAALKAEYETATATMEERHGVAALNARFQKAMGLSVARHTAQLNAILAFLRKKFGARSVAQAMAAFDEQAAKRDARRKTA